MDRGSTCNEELEAALSLLALTPGLVIGARRAVGCAGEEELDSHEEEYPVLGYYLQRSNEGITSLYMCTPGRFLCFECADSGVTFTMATPIERIQRLEEQVLVEGVQLRIEIDADVLVQRIELEQVSGDDPEAGPGRRLGRSDGRMSSMPSGYTLRASEPSQRASLQEFSRVLRVSIGL